MNTYGTIFIVSTPIGNLGDMTYRAVETLKNVDLIVAEDTRRTICLLNHFDIKNNLISNHSHNEYDKVDDIIETINHFRLFDFILDKAKFKLTENLIKKMHYILKNATSDSEKDWFNVGDYKKLANTVSGLETAKPAEVHKKMKELIYSYEKNEKIEINDIIDFHYKFESIHPFQDGNGRLGRLIMFKECLRHNIVPFIIEDDIKFYYYRGLKEWRKNKTYLIETCLSMQDKFKEWLKYFGIRII